MAAAGRWLRTPAGDGAAYSDFDQQRQGLAQSVPPRRRPPRCNRGYIGQECLGAGTQVAPSGSATTAVQVRTPPHHNHSPAGRPTAAPRPEPRTHSSADAEPASACPISPGPLPRQPPAGRESISPPHVRTTDERRPMIDVAEPLSDSQAPVVRALWHTTKLEHRGDPTDPPNHSRSPHSHGVDRHRRARPSGALPRTATTVRL